MSELSYEEKIKQIEELIIINANPKWSKLEGWLYISATLNSPMVGLGKSTDDLDKLRRRIEINIYKITGNLKTNEKTGKTLNSIEDFAKLDGYMMRRAARLRFHKKVKEFWKRIFGKGEKKLLTEGETAREKSTNGRDEFVEKLKVEETRNRDTGDKRQNETKRQRQNDEGKQSQNDGNGTKNTIEEREE